MRHRDLIFKLVLSISILTAAVSTLTGCESKADKSLKSLLTPEFTRLLNNKSLEKKDIPSLAAFSMALKAFIVAHKADGKKASLKAAEKLLQLRENAKPLMDQVNRDIKAKIEAGTLKIQNVYHKSSSYLEKIKEAKKKHSFLNPLKFKKDNCYSWYTGREFEKDPVMKLRIGKATHVGNSEVLMKKVFYPSELDLRDPARALQEIHKTEPEYANLIQPAIKVKCSEVEKLTDEYKIILESMKTLNAEKVEAQQLKMLYSDSII